jgi:Cof subfamily protein (haloacid dehalogenase superfamily)
MRTLGWIVLDIDGTITNNKFSVPKKVSLYLQTLAKHSWKIIFATGRTFTFASSVLSELNFPYILAAQNGSVAIQMPDKKILLKNYMNGKLFKNIEIAYKGFDSDFLVYSGFEKGDFCYWRPHKFNNEHLAYLEDLKTRQKQSWHIVEQFDQNHIREAPYVKSFGDLEMINEIRKRLQEDQNFECCSIKDPFEERYRLLQITAKNASKGHCINQLKKLMDKNAYIIAAGDDENDLTMLKMANERIVLPSAPDYLKEIATIMAPPVEELGIIDALDMAIAKMSK